MRLRSFVLIVLCSCVAIELHAQLEYGPVDPKQKLEPLPTNIILVPGATPSASDPRTPLPESGTVKKNVYDNRYFAMSYTFPEDWLQEYEGPPPSDAGNYVLAELVPAKSSGTRGSILVTAQDLFFSKRSAEDTVRDSFKRLSADYKAEGEPLQVTIAGRSFWRFNYQSSIAGLHWSVLTTEMRCHAVQFVFTGPDAKLLDHLVDDLSHIEFTQPHAEPRCIANYATAENVLSKVEPILTDHKFNAIPVRILIGKNGKVQHVHVISAFAEQARIITEALQQWRFKPHTANGEAVEVETGLRFGSDTGHRHKTPSAMSSAQ